MVTAKQKGKYGISLFPLTIALSDLPPITKVTVDYETLPKNKFAIKINNEDIYNLVKEEVNYDPS